MNKKLHLFILLFPFILNAQTQMGNDIDGEEASDQSGYSVSLSSDGSIVAIGALYNDGNGNKSGHVRIYNNSANTWTQIGDDIDGEAADDQLGYSVSLSSDGNIVAIGAHGNDKNGSFSGHVRIFENSGGIWAQVGGDIDGETTGDQSGYSISLSSDGNIVAIGAIGNDENGADSGHVRIFENSGGTWTQVGSDIDGEAAGDRSGRSVSLSSDGRIVAIGADSNDENGDGSGQVRIFENNANTWTQIGSDINGESAWDFSGNRISLNSDGTIVAIGAPENDGNGNESGHVRVYKNVAGTWTQVGSDIDGEAANDRSGTSVSLSTDGSVVAIGAYYNTGNFSLGGQVRIYKNSADTWTQVGSDIDGEAEGDLSGRSVSLSSDGSIVAIGAISNDENGDSSGHVRIYDLSAALSTVLGIADEFVSKNFTVFPNPSTTNFTISLTNGLKLNEVCLIDNYGRQLLKSTNLEMDISTISQGVYYLKVTTDKGIGIKKVIVE